MNLAQICDRILESKKYRYLARSVVERAVAFGAARAQKASEIEDRARRKLHQVFGAYFAHDGARDFPARPGEDVIDRARRLLPLHASTRERAPIIERFYVEVFQRTGVPKSILDLGCGLSPVALPWMHLPSTTSYAALEIDQRLVATGNEFLVALGRPASVIWGDALEAATQPPAELVFLLKMAPCLEQQEAGSTHRLLANISSPNVVLSYPLRSLGGARKGMALNYREDGNALVDALGCKGEFLEIGGELVLIISGRAQIGRSEIRND